MVADILGEYGTKLAIAVLGVAIGLGLLVAALWFIRARRGSSPFVRGGKNRQPRLQVLDAAAVDTRRRLVLLRRDNVEHLIMIGGPTDIVIESGIIAEQAAFANQRPQPSGAVAQPAPQARPQPPANPQLPPRASAPPAPPIVPPPTPATPITVQPTQDQKIVAQAPPGGRPPVTEKTADLLDAARERVFGTEAAPIRPSDAPSSLKTAVERPRQIGSDFQAILEQEMENSLAAQNIPAPIVRPSAPAQSLAHVAMLDATPKSPAPEPSLQEEVAKIFGEMTADRDK